MLAGPFDYEPGFLNNATKAGVPENRRHAHEFWHQVSPACHVRGVRQPDPDIFRQPLPRISSTRFYEPFGLHSSGRTETIVPDAKVGQYIITARKKNNDWFVGGLTDWSERDFQLKLDFLPTGNYISHHLQRRHQCR